MRKKMVAGNWKMNMTPSGAVKLAEELKPMVKNDDVDVVFCVPAIDIVPVVNEVKDTNIKVGAENMFYEEKGAYTGELSPEMLVDAGVSYVIIGHSERRQYFHETDEIINKKMRKISFFRFFAVERVLNSVRAELHLNLSKNRLSTLSNTYHRKRLLIVLLHTNLYGR